MMSRCLVGMLLVLSFVSYGDSTPISAKELVVFLEKKDSRVESKIAAIELFVKYSGSLDQGSLAKITQIYLGAKEPRFCDALAELILPKLTGQALVTVALKRFGEVDDFEKKDALLSTLINAKRRSGAKSSDIYNYLFEILDKYASERYRRYYISQYADFIFAMAMASGLKEDLFKKVVAGIVNAQKADDIAAYTSLLAKIARFIPPDELERIGQKISTMPLGSEERRKLENIVGPLRAQYNPTEFKGMSDLDLVALVSDKSADVKSRLKALRFLTLKHGRILFSGESKKVAESLLSIARDQNDAKEIRGAILARLAGEFDVLSNDKDKSRNVELTKKVLSELGHGTYPELFLNFLFLINPVVFEKGKLWDVLEKLNSTSSGDIRSVVLYFKITKGDGSLKKEAIPKVLEILRSPDGLGDFGKNCLVNVLRICCPDDILKRKLAAMDDNDRKLLKTFLDL